MKILDYLERKFGFLSIPNLTYYLIIGQVLVFLLVTLNPQYQNYLQLSGSLVLSGQWWRLIMFLFIPIVDSPLFAAFIWYLYYLYGTQLEHSWGSFRYLVYILVAYLLTIILAFLIPAAYFSNIHIYTSLFLAFAYLNPDFTLLLMFILPVKVKWLAMLTWIGIFYILLTGSFMAKIIALLSVFNFLLFFGSHIWQSILFHGHSTSARMKESNTRLRKPYHVCRICKRDEVSDPDMYINYCNECVPQACYCEKHINSHSHIKTKTAYPS